MHINDTVFSIYPDEPNYFFSYTFQSDLYKKDIVNIIGSLSSTGQVSHTHVYMVQALVVYFYMNEFHTSYVHVDALINQWALNLIT